MTPKLQSGNRSPRGHEPAPATPWTPERAQAWSRKTGWLVGCNFSPRTAINQLETWQQTDTNEPPVWFHDILRRDGAPHFAAQVDFIKRLTGKTR